MNKNHLLHNLSYIKELYIIIILLNIYGFYNNNPIYYLSILLILCLLFFYRNNYIHTDTKYFISPSSSRVMDIIETNNENIIINHISLFDRHFMIAPVDCKVIDIQNIHIDNNDAERKRVTFQDIDGNIFSIDQIVNKLFSHMFIYGFLPSFIYKERCVVFSKVGDYLKQGERYGLIRFGSMIQYNLPKKYKLNIQKNIHYSLGCNIAFL